MGHYENKIMDVYGSLTEDEIAVLSARQARLIPAIDGDSEVV